MRRIKNKVLDNKEQACLPTTSDEERRRLLSFIVCDGGSSGVEFAAELFYLINEDLAHTCLVFSVMGFLSTSSGVEVIF